MKNLSQHLNESIMTTHKRSWVTYKPGYPILYKEILDGHFTILHKHEFEELCDWLIEMDIKDLTISVLERFTELILHEVDPKFKSIKIDGITMTMNKLVDLRSNSSISEFDDSIMYTPSTGFILAIFNKPAFLRVAEKNEDDKKYFEDIKSKLSKIIYSKNYDRDWPDVSEYFKKLTTHFK